jgi:predicted Zn-dependent protease with MMP-like domain
MNIERFEELVAEAVEDLPEEFQEKLENIDVVVEEWPRREDLEEVGLDPRDRAALLGLYHGVPLTHRGSQYAALPDIITIYKGPIERLCGDDGEQIRRQVQHTVIHEIAHYYGISDERLEELGSY